MFERDFGDFVALLDGVLSLNPNWKPVPPTGKALFFKALEPYSFEVVSRAMTAHIRDSQRGKFQPTPADIIAQIESAQGGDGRPAADEAWAKVHGADDERETIVWTAEMRDAFAVCRPVLATGDKVGARMAFKDAYARLIAEAQRNGRPVKWEVSLGSDPAKREAPVRQAVDLGQLPAPTAHALLPSTAPANVSPIGLARLKAEVAKLVPAHERAQKAHDEQVKREQEALANRKRVLAEQAAKVRHQ